MKPVTASPVLPLKVDSTVFEAGEGEIQSHTPVLYKIGMLLGFNDEALHTLVEEVCATISKQQESQGDSYSIRIALIKCLVCKCVFITSSRLFQRASVNASEMALSYRIVYTLKTTIGLNETELAVILNTTPLSIRTRFNKALAFLEHH